MENRGYSTSSLVNRLQRNGDYIYDYPSYLWMYGFTKWLEIRDAIQKSKSKHKEVIEQELNMFFERMPKIIDIPPLPQKISIGNGKSSAEEGPSNKKEHEVKFSIDDIFRHLSMLYLHHPRVEYYALGTVLHEPECGMAFIDLDGQYYF